MASRPKRASTLGKHYDEDSGSDEDEDVKPCSSDDESYKASSSSSDEDDEVDGSDPDDESDYGDEVTSFVEMMMDADGDRRAENDATLNEEVLAINHDTLATRGNILNALRDFHALSRNREGARLLQGAEPGADPATQAVRAAFVTRAAAMRRCIVTATDALVAATRMSRPRALDCPDAADSFLHWLAGSMPVGKRAALFAAVPEGASHAIEQVMGGGVDDAVLTACRAQLATLLASDWAAPSNARFLLRNVAGSIFTLMRAARASGAVSDDILDGLRAKERSFAAERRKGRHSARFGRKLVPSFDPPAEGETKVALRHSEQVSRTTHFVTWLVHHVPSAALENITQASLLAFFEHTALERDADPRVARFLRDLGDVVLSLRLASYTKTMFDLVARPRDYRFRVELSVKDDISCVAHLPLDVAAAEHAFRARLTEALSRDRPSRVNGCITVVRDGAPVQLWRKWLPLADVWAMPPAEWPERLEDDLLDPLRTRLLRAVKRHHEVTLNVTYAAASASASASAAAKKGRK